MAPWDRDLEMARGKDAVARGPPGSKKKRRGAYQMPITVAGCFLGLLLLLVIFNRKSDHNGAQHSGSSSRQPRSGGGGSGGGSKAPLAAGRPGAEQPSVFGYKVLAEYPHDADAFLQGLQFDRRCEGSGSKRTCRDIFWESTGLNGASTVREVDLESGKVLRSKALPREDFGEGLTRHGDRLYQITWRSGKAWSYAADDFEDVQETSTKLKDGWGITSDGTHLIVGDSSERLAFIDPKTMKTQRTISVTDDGRPVVWLNELEYIDGLIWGNIWQTDCIAQIDPANGAVVGWLRLPRLRQRALDAAASDAKANAAGATPNGRRTSPEVVNGIAYDAEQGRLFVTGKLWPRIYQIATEEVPAERAAEALAKARAECIVRGGDLFG